MDAMVNLPARSTHAATIITTPVIPAKAAKACRLFRPDYDLLIERERQPPPGCGSRS
jgi:hypothetical protein